MANFKLDTSVNPTVERSADEIKAIQTQLNNSGAGLAVDGIWGPKTQVAYSAYNQPVQQYAPAPSINTGEVVIPKTRNDVLQAMNGYSGSGDYSLPSLPNVDIGAVYDDSIAQYKNALTAAYDSQKISTEAQAAKLAEQANKARTQAYTTARVNAIGNNEKTAALGLGGNLYTTPQSGFSETSRTAENIAMRNNINAVTANENQQQADLALELLKAGYTKDSNYATYMAQTLIDKANAQESQAQTKFRNELTMYDMAQAAANEYNALHPATPTYSYGGYSSGGGSGGYSGLTASGGSSGSGGGSSGNSSGGSSSAASTGTANSVTSSSQAKAAVNQAYENSGYSASAAVATAMKLYSQGAINATTYSNLYDYVQNLEKTKASTNNSGKAYANLTPILSLKE